jgi:hypothetical protein
MNIILHRGTRKTETTILFRKDTKQALTSRFRCDVLALSLLDQPAAWTGQSETVS